MRNLDLVFTKINEFVWINFTKRTLSKRQIPACLFSVTFYSEIMNHELIQHVASYFHWYSCCPPSWIQWIRLQGWIQESRLGCGKYVLKQGLSNGEIHTCIHILFKAGIRRCQTRPPACCCRPFEFAVICACCLPFFASKSFLKSVGLPETSTVDNWLSICSCCKHSATQSPVKFQGDGKNTYKLSSSSLFIVFYRMTRYVYFSCCCSSQLFLSMIFTWY